MKGGAGFGKWFGKNIMGVVERGEPTAKENQAREELFNYYTNGSEYLDKNNFLKYLKVTFFNSAWPGLDEPPWSTKVTKPKFLSLLLYTTVFAG